MNMAHEHEEYRQQGEAPTHAQAAQAQPEPVQRALPSYPAETRRRRGFPYKSPLLACLLSLMPGLGQVYIGYYQRGFAHVAIFALLILALNNGAGDLAPMFGVFMAFFVVYNIIDAGRRASLYNQAVDGFDGIDMPSDIRMPTSGSMGWGVALVVFGILLLLNTRFDVSMAWMEDWWPAAGILLGGYLIYKSRKNGGD